MKRFRATLPTVVPAAALLLAAATAAHACGPLPGGDLVGDARESVKAFMSMSLAQVALTFCRRSALEAA